MRLIDADALEREYRDQFDSVYKNIRDSVNPADFYVERKASYDKKLVKMEMEAFCEYLHHRPTIDAVPVVRCKDCKHHDVFGWCVELERGTAGEAFCAYGERKER